MRFALALLCAGVVGFLLRVLAALVLDAKNSSRTARIYFAKFTPSKRQSELIVISQGEHKWDESSEPSRRIAS